MMSIAIEAAQEPQPKPLKRKILENNDIANTISAGKALTDQQLSLSNSYESALQDTSKDAVASEVLNTSVNSSFDPTWIRPAYLITRDIVSAENTQEQDAIESDPNDITNKDNKANPEGLDKETKGYLLKTHAAADDFDDTLAKIRELKSEAAKLEAKGEPNDSLVAEIRDTQQELRLEVIQYSDMMNMALDRVSDKADTLDSALVQSIYKDSAELNTKMDLKIIDTIKDGDLIMDKRERELLGSSMDGNSSKLDQLHRGTNTKSASLENRNDSPRPNF